MAQGCGWGHLHSGGYALLAVYGSGVLKLNSQDLYLSRPSSKSVAPDLLLETGHGRWPGRFRFGLRLPFAVRLPTTVRFLIVIQIEEKVNNTRPTDVSVVTLVAVPVCVAGRTASCDLNHERQSCLSSVAAQYRCGAVHRGNTLFIFRPVPLSIPVSPCSAFRTGHPTPLGRDPVAFRSGPAPLGRDPTPLGRDPTPL